MAGGPTIIWDDGVVGGNQPPEGFVEKKVSHDPLTVGVMRGQAEKLGRKARSRLATVPRRRWPSTRRVWVEVRHAPTGAGRVGARLDSSVHLVATGSSPDEARKAAAAIEFGRADWAQERVGGHSGLAILRGSRIGGRVVRGG